MPPLIITLWLKFQIGSKKQYFASRDCYAKLFGKHELNWILLPWSVRFAISILPVLCGGNKVLWRARIENPFTSSRKLVPKRSCGCLRPILGLLVVSQWCALVTFGCYVVWRDVFLCHPILGVISIRSFKALASSKSYPPTSPQLEIN